MQASAHSSLRMTPWKLRRAPGPPGTPGCGYNDIWGSDCERMGQTCGSSAAFYRDCCENAMSPSFIHSFTHALVEQPWE